MRRLLILVVLLGSVTGVVAQRRTFPRRGTAGGAGVLACAHAASLAASEVYAASASLTDVQTAVNTAYTTAAINTVCIPGGSASWTSGINLPGMNQTAKTLTIRGAGNPQCPPSTSDTSTVITNTSGISTAASDNLFTITASATAFVRISNITMKYGVASSCPCPPGDNGNFDLVYVTGTEADVAARLDHNRIYDNNLTTSANRLIHWESVYGLLDCNYVKRDAFGQSAEVFGSQSGGNDQGFTAWTRPLSWGVGSPNSTNQAVYFENNTLLDAQPQEGFIDQYIGARVVWRHNNGTGNSNGDHGFDSQVRSAFSYEQYNNIFTNSSGTILGGISQIRGGTALAFNDQYLGLTTWGDIKPVYYRGPYCAAFYSPSTCTICGGGAQTCGNYSTRCAPLNNITCGATGDWNLEARGQLDGTQYDISSDHLTTVALNAANGTRFSILHPDTTCTGAATGDCNRGVDCQTGLAGCGTDGYPGRDQPGITHDQKSAPIYAWNNGTVHITPDSLDQSSPLACSNPGANPPCTVSTSKNTSYWVAENRDYYNASTIQTDLTHPFNGTPVAGIGMGWGLDRFKPTSCTVGTAYFSQDVGTQGTLYQCGPSANQWSVYYIPYTYPHPLSTTP